MSAQSLECCPRCHVPQFHRLVSTCTGNGFAIGAETHAPERTLMSAQSLECCPRCHVPQFHRLVSTCTSQGFAIGAETHAVYKILMSSHSLECCPRCHVPQFHRLVITCTGQGFAIGAETHAPDNILMLQTIALLHTVRGLLQRYTCNHLGVIRCPSGLRELFEFFPCFQSLQQRLKRLSG